jgi:hypothetical protein
LALTPLNVFLQTLYVQHSHKERVAGDLIMQDIMPLEVVERLKLRKQTQFQRQRSSNASAQLKSTSTDNILQLPNDAHNEDVVYKRWHSGVSVLFADIVGYTSMSKELIPEQVCWPSWPQGEA